MKLRNLVSSAEFIEAGGQRCLRLEMENPGGQCWFLLLEPKKRNEKLHSPIHRFPVVPDLSGNAYLCLDHDRLGPVCFRTAVVQGSCVHYTGRLVFDAKQRLYTLQFRPEDGIQPERPKKRAAVQ